MPHTFLLLTIWLYISSIVLYPFNTVTCSVHFFVMLLDQQMACICCYSNISIESSLLIFYAQCVAAWWTNERVSIRSDSEGVVSVVWSFVFKYSYRCSILKIPRAYLILVIIVCSSNTRKLVINIF